MTQQLTPQAVTMLIAGLIVFWVSIATLVRLHGRRAHGAARPSRESRG